MSAVELFQYDGREVRTVTIDGEPWFVAADVACRCSGTWRPGASRSRWARRGPSLHVSRSTRVTAKGLAWLAGRYGQAVSA